MRSDGIRAAVALIMASALLTGCGEASEEGKFSGYVEAEYIYVAAPDSGWIVSAPKRAGDAVETEDTLFELDPERQEAARDEAARRLEQAAAQARDLASGARAEEIAAVEAQLAEAEAARENAETSFERVKTLVARGVAPQAQLDDATAAVDEAKARVRAIEANLATARLAGRAETRNAADAGREAAEAALRQAQWAVDQRCVRAQVSGRVEQVFLRKGEFATAGAPVLALLPPDGLKIRFFAPEADLAGLAPGARVMVSADALDAPIPARVTFVATEAEYTPPVIYSAESREKLVFMIEARPETDAKLRALLRPGQPVDVRLP